MSGKSALSEQFMADLLDELAGIRESVDALTTTLNIGLRPTPQVERMHQALGLCWCGETHTFAQALLLNGAADATTEGDDTDACG